MEVVQQLLQLASTLFIVSIGIFIACLPVLYVYDRYIQRSHSVVRNYPIIGRMRYTLEELGTFLRQYFFALDRDELPFDRATRAWVYRAAKGVSVLQPFGSTRPYHSPGNVVFTPEISATLSGTKAPSGVVIGPDCRFPYKNKHLVHISGMSFGAISRPAVQALAQGAKRAGRWVNTGEGGYSEYHSEGNCDIVFQIGTAKFGVRNDDATLSEKRLRNVASDPNVKMFEVKLSQGAKPGKGGILPKGKITEEIARVRAIPNDQDCYSPNRHPEIHDCSSLLDFVARVRDITGKPTGFKFVMGNPRWVQDLIEEINARGIDSAPDFITLDGGEGGTGAAPSTHIEALGMSIRDSLPLLVDLLESAGLSERIKIVASGKLIHPLHASWAIATGADFVTTARGPMFALGCIQALQCHMNTCPTGIATHDEERQWGLDVRDKRVRVARYLKKMDAEIEAVAHSCGVDKPRGLERQHMQIVLPSGSPIPSTTFYREHAARFGLFQVHNSVESVAVASGQG